MAEFASGLLGECREKKVKELLSIRMKGDATIRWTRRALFVITPLSPDCIGPARLHDHVDKARLNDLLVEKGGDAESVVNRRRVGHAGWLIGLIGGDPEFDERRSRLPRGRPQSAQLTALIERDQSFVS